VYHKLSKMTQNQLIS